MNLKIEVHNQNIEIIDSKYKLICKNIYLIVIIELIIFKNLKKITNYYKVGNYRNILI